MRIPGPRRCARQCQCQLRWCRSGSERQALLSQRSERGAGRRSMIRSSVSATCRALMPVSTAVARHSRVNSSIMVSSQIARPPPIRSSVVSHYNLRIKSVCHPERNEGSRSRRPCGRIGFSQATGAESRGGEMPRGIPRCADSAQDDGHIR